NDDFVAFRMAHGVAHGLLRDAKEVETDCFVADSNRPGKFQRTMHAMPVGGFFAQGSQSCRQAAGCEHSWLKPASKIARDRYVAVHDLGRFGESFGSRRVLNLIASRF